MSSEGKRATRIRLFGLAAVFSGLLLAGCARRESPAPEGSPPPTSAASAGPATPATAASPVTTAAAMPATAAPAPATVVAVPSPAPKAAARMPASPIRSLAEPAPQPAASEPRPAPAGASASKVDDPGGTVAVASTNPGATRIGAEKCKICHKLQYASWADTAHARRIPPLECESCHGPGSEYKTLTTMKDPAKAKAAGLVMPDAAFCATCHKRDWKSDMLSKAHAHKAKTAS